MKKFSRYGVCIIVVLFFLLMNTPIYAYESTGKWHDEYVYDNEEELEEETQEAIRETLEEFYNQTSIKAIVVTVQNEKDKTGNEVVHETMEEYGKDDVIVLLFSKGRKLISCSYEDIDIFPYIRSIVGVSSIEYDNFIKNAVENILKQIAEAENKTFKIQKEKVNLLELLSGEDMKNLLEIVMSVGSIVVIIFIVLILEIFIIRLCIEELINTFSS